MPCWKACPVWPRRCWSVRWPEALDLTFKRIQFTPDLMPSDVTGTEVIQEDPHTQERGFQFLPGPIFANFVLADEINRTPPKTQAAMLEAMQERQVSVGGEVHLVPDPFIVLATQNPLEQEGTYPLPEAQLDRFLLHIRVDYPSGAEEWEIARRVTFGEDGGDHSRACRVPKSSRCSSWCIACRSATRCWDTPGPWSAPRVPGREEATEFVNKWVSWGAGPRGLLTLVNCAKARALLHGRYHATVGDVQAMARPALRHRIAGNYAAQANQRQQRAVDRDAAGNDSQRPPLRTAGRGR